MNNLSMPVFVNMSGKKVLILGGGKIALRRVNTLLQFGTDIHVVTLKARDELLKYADDGRITLTLGTSEYGTDRKLAFVLACTDNAEFNAQVCRRAREAGIPANNASDRGDCDFYFPAVIIGEDYSVGVCGTGEDHGRVREVAGKIREEYGVKREDV